MSEKLTNNNIDDIFRNSIDNMETQPSESFWINASQDALFKNNLEKKRSINKWRIAAAALAVMFIGLAAYVVYMQKQLSEVKGKLSTVESRTYVQPAQVAKASTASIDNTPVVAEHEKNVTSSVSQNSTEIKQQENNNAIVSTTNANNTFNAVQPLAHSKVKHKKHTNNNTVTYVNSNQITNNTNILVSPTESNTSNTSETKTTEGPASISASGENTIPGTNTSLFTINESIVPVQSDIKVAKKPPLTNLSVSLFYEPYISDELLENEADDIVTVNNVSANEEEVHPFTMGIKADYKISKHWSLVAGCLFYNFNVALSPTTIYAQKQQDGEVGYTLQTSIGSVACPYVNSPKVGDGLVVSGEEKANYVCIPLQIKYNFISQSRWSFYVTGGIEANMVIFRQMDMHWKAFNWQEGNATEGIDNSKKVYGSYYFAPGIRYSLFKGISIFFEPSLQGSSVYSSALSSDPYLGLGGGVTYHF